MAEEQEQTCLKECIRFVNDLTKKLNSSKDLKKFHKIVKSRKVNDIDDDEFYDSAYQFVNGDFDVMKKLGNALKDGMTPSYIRRPTITRASLSADERVLNNSCRIYSCKDRESDAKRDPDYIYQPWEVIQSASIPRSSNKISTETEKREAVLLWESRRSELDLVLDMLKVAKRMLKRALEMIEKNEWPEDVKLKDYLLDNGVKMKLLENIFGGFDLEMYMLPPLKRLPTLVNVLRREKKDVVSAIEELNHWRRKNYF